MSATSEDPATVSKTNPRRHLGSNLILVDGEVRKIPRPRNAFMIYAGEFRRIFSNMYPAESNIQTSVRLGKAWKVMPYNHKQSYFRLSKLEDEHHRHKYPDYHYIPAARKMKARKAAEAEEEEAEKPTDRRSTEVVPSKRTKLIPISPRPRLLGANTPLGPDEIQVLTPQKAQLLLAGTPLALIDSDLGLDSVDPRGGSRRPPLPSRQAMQSLAQTIRLARSGEEAAKKEYEERKRREQTNMKKPYSIAGAHGEDKDCYIVADSKRYADKTRAAQNLLSAAPFSISPQPHSSTVPQAPARIPTDELTRRFATHDQSVSTREPASRDHPSFTLPLVSQDKYNVINREANDNNNDLDDDILEMSQLRPGRSRSRVTQDDTMRVPMPRSVSCQVARDQYINPSLQPPVVSHANQDQHYRQEHPHLVPGYCWYARPAVAYTSGPGIAMPTQSFYRGAVAESADSKFGSCAPIAPRNCPSVSSPFVCDGLCCNELTTAATSQSVPVEPGMSLAKQMGGGNMAPQSRPSEPTSQYLCSAFKTLSETTVNDLTSFAMTEDRLARQPSAT